MVGFFWCLQRIIKKHIAYRNNILLGFLYKSIIDLNLSVKTVIEKAKIGYYHMILAIIVNSRVGTKNYAQHSSVKQQLNAGK